MRKLLAGLAVVGLLSVASPASAATQSQSFTHVSWQNGAGFSFDTATPGEITATATWSPVRNGQEMTLYVRGGAVGVHDVCRVTGSGGTLTCSGVTEAGSYVVGFKPSGPGGGPVDVTLTVTITP